MRIPPTYEEKLDILKNWIGYGEPLRSCHTCKNFVPREPGTGEREDGYCSKFEFKIKTYGSCQFYKTNRIK